MSPSDIVEQNPFTHIVTSSPEDVPGSPQRAVLRMQATRVGVCSERLQSHSIVQPRELKLQLARCLYSLPEQTAHACSLPTAPKRVRTLLRQQPRSRHSEPARTRARAAHGRAWPGRAPTVRADGVRWLSRHARCLSRSSNLRAEGSSGISRF